jgi:hypothetical protein
VLAAASWAAFSENDMLMTNDLSVSSCENTAKLDQVMACSLQVSPDSRLVALWFQHLESWFVIIGNDAALAHKTLLFQIISNSVEAQEN